MSPIRYEKKKGSGTQANNPLHGVTLKAMLEFLIENHGWEFMGEKVRINCFRKNPSLKSSLQFLRRTDWAREEVENLYLSCIE